VWYSSILQFKSMKLNFLTTITVCHTQASKFSAECASECVENQQSYRYEFGVLLFVTQCTIKPNSCLMHVWATGGRLSLKHFCNCFMFYVSACAFIVQLLLIRPLLFGEPYASCLAFNLTLHARLQIELIGWLILRATTALPPFRHAPWELFVPTSSRSRRLNGRKRQRTNVAVRSCDWVAAGACCSSWL